MLYAGRAPAATTRSRDRSLGGRNNDQMRRPDTRLQPSRAVFPAARAPQPPLFLAVRAPLPSPFLDAAASSARARPLAGLGEGRFIGLPLAPRRFTPRLESGQTSAAARRRAARGLHGKGGSPHAAGATRGPSKAEQHRDQSDDNELGRASPHARSSRISMAPLRHARLPPFSAETVAADASSAEIGRPSFEFVVHGPYQFPRTGAGASAKRRASRKLSRSRERLEEPRPHRYIGSRRMCRPDCHARRHACECGRMHRRHSKGSAGASRVRLTASESARTVLYNHHYPADPGRG